MPLKRSPEMALVGFFLAKFGTRNRDNSNASPSPPRQLEVANWAKAYAMFFRALGGDRTLSQFANSLKNVRDGFDSHLDTGRVGWRESSADLSERPPMPLQTAQANILTLWGDRSEGEVWNAVQPFADLNVRTTPAWIIADIMAEDASRISSRIVGTEGGTKVVVSSKIERDPSLRAEAIRLHGKLCCVCGFSFESMYGEWGKDFAIVHHLRLLADADGVERETNPATDLAVVCANCHAMIHRRREVVLSIDDLRKRLRIEPAMSR